MKKLNMYKIVRAIAIIAVMSIFMLLCAGCDGGHDAIGYSGPMVMPRGGGIMILP